MKGFKASTNVIPLPDARAVDETAALWIMRLDDPGLSQARREELQVWLAQSERHASAFERLAGLWGALGSLEILADYQAANERAVPQPAGWYKSAWMAVAASVLAIVVGTLLINGIGLAPAGKTLQFSAAYATQVGDHQTLSLPDGSRVSLNTDSVIKVNYSAAARDVQLIRGEAYFSVASDVSRPFSVRTPRGVVTAVGTAFTVRVRPRAMDLVVAEGEVSFAPAAEISASLSANVPQPAPPRTYAAGQSVKLDGDARVIEEIPLPVIQRKLSWREGMLDFDGEPLSEVIRDVGRYTELRIEIDDPTLGDLPVAGRFKIGEIDALLEALEIMVGLEVQHLDSGRVRLTKSG